MFLALLTYYSFSLSVTPENEFFFYDLNDVTEYRVETNKNALISRFSFGLYGNGVYLQGDCDNTSYKVNNSLSFFPTGIDFGFKAGYKIANFDFYYQHRCLHPITPYWQKGARDKIEGSYTEIGIKVSGQNIIKHF